MNTEDRHKSNSESPVFFIGAPRSGTTLIFEIYARHPELAWPSNYSEWFPRLPGFNLLVRALNSERLQLIGQKRQYGRVLPGNRFLPQPDEAYAFWDHYGPPGFSSSFMRNAKATPDQTRRLRDAVARLTRWQGRRYFTAKLTGPPRLTLLASIFPEARFVHVVRDGRAVVNSLMRVGFWAEKGGFEKPFWQDALNEKEISAWQNGGSDPVLLAALQWRAILEQIAIERQTIEKNRFVTVRYEDFVADPHGSLSGLFKFAGLVDNSRGHDLISKGAQLVNKNPMPSTVFDERQCAELEGLAGPMLSHYGYI